MITTDTPLSEIQTLRDATLALFVPLSQYIAGSGPEFLVPANAAADVMRTLVSKYGADVA